MIILARASFAFHLKAFASKTLIIQCTNLQAVEEVVSKTTGFPWSVLDIEPATKDEEEAFATVPIVGMPVLSKLQLRDWRKKKFAGLNGQSLFAERVNSGTCTSESSTRCSQQDGPGGEADNLRAAGTRSVPEHELSDRIATEEPIKAEPNPAAKKQSTSAGRDDAVTNNRDARVAKEESSGSPETDSKLAAVNTEAKPAKEAAAANMDRTEKDAAMAPAPALAGSAASSRATSTADETYLVDLSQTEMNEKAMDKNATNDAEENARRKAAEKARKKAAKRAKKAAEKARKNSVKEAEKMVRIQVEEKANSDRVNISLKISFRDTASATDVDGPLQAIPPVAPAENGALPDADGSEGSLAEEKATEEAEEAAQTLIQAERNLAARLRMEAAASESATAADEKQVEGCQTTGDGATIPVRGSKPDKFYHSGEHEVYLTYSQFQVASLDAVSPGPIPVANESKAR